MNNLKVNYERILEVLKYKMNNFCHTKDVNQSSAT